MTLTDTNSLDKIRQIKEAKEKQESAIAEEIKKLPEKLKTFLETQPLYSKVPFYLEIKRNQFYVSKVVITCPVCKAEYPFTDRRRYGTMESPALETGNCFFAYTCTGCDQQQFSCWVEVNTLGKWARKIGQSPALESKISKDLELALGDSIELYKKAKTCIGQSYGLAACAYLRRILEDKISPILHDIRKYLVDSGSEQKTIDELDSILKKKTADERLAEAYKILPQSLQIDGQNPLKLIYGLLSDGLHNQDEEKCVNTALKLSAAFEFLVIELSKHEHNVTMYREKMKEAAEMNNNLIKEFAKKG